MRPRAGASALGVAVLIAVAAATQDIAERDLYFSDPANLSRLLSEAEEALEAGESRGARAFASAVVETVRADPSTALRPLLPRALLLRARIHLAAGDRSAAVADIEEATRIEPGSGVSPERSPFATLVRQARDRLLGSLSVTSTPAGAAVSVEGRTLGTTPLEAAPVLAGRRYVKVQRPGFAAVEREVVVASGKPARLQVDLDRRGSTLLLLTDADEARVTVDGEEIGVARRPGREQADQLVAAFNWPLDPDHPPALLLWQPAPPGTHLVALEAPCRRSLRQAVEVPEGADATALLPMERAAGRLRLEAPAGADLVLDGRRLGPAPLVTEELCPGPHLLQVSGPPGRTTRSTVWVQDGEQTRLEIDYRPVLALLSRDPDLREWLRHSESFNLVLVDETGEMDAARLLAGDGVNLAVRDMVAGAQAADLLAWRDPSDGSLRLLAAASRQPDRLAVAGSAGREAALARLDAALPLVRADLGLVAVRTRFTERPVVAALDAGGPAQQAGIRAGDELVAVDGVAVTGPAAIDAVLARHQPGDAIEVICRLLAEERRHPVVLGRAALDPDLGGATGAALNAVIARAGYALASGGAPEHELQRAKAYLAQQDWEAALSALAGADLAAGPGVGPGSVQYYQAQAALALGRPGEARAALARAITHPEARLLGPLGPPVVPLARALLEELGEEEE